MNSRAVFPLPIPKKIRPKIRARPKSENPTQTDFILEAAKAYLLKPDNRKTAS